MWKGGGTLTRRQRKKPPVRVSVPYAPTPKGKAAERKARGPITVPYAPTPTGKAAEHRAKTHAALSILRGAHVPPDPQTALQQAVLSGVSPSEEFRKLYGNDVADKIDQERIRHYVAPREGIHADPLAELAIDTVATAGLGGAAGLVSKGAKAALAGTKAAKAIKASEEIAAEGGAASKAANALRGGFAKGRPGGVLLRDGEKIDLAAARREGAIRRALRTGGVSRAAGKVAGKVEPAAVRAKRLKALSKLAKTAEKAPKPVRVGAKVGARVAAHPFKHPFTAPFTAQTPFALAHGDPKEFLKAAEGHGALADVAGVAGGVAGSLPVAGQVAREAVNLPAVIVPSLYLTGKAGVEAAGGNSQEFDKLWNNWVKTGLLPALAKGDPNAAIQSLKHHPLYSALEASGALSAVGRGAGAITRAASNGKVGGLARPDLTVEGYPNVKVQRQYSRDLIRQAAQRAYDRKSGNVIRPGTGNRLTPTLEHRGDYLFRKHVVRDAGDRFNANAQDAQRLGRQQSYKTAADLLPRKKVLGVFKKLDRASADVVVHAIERVVRHPETFHQDLQHYLDQLDAVANDTVGGQPVLDRAEMAANRSMAANIKKALSHGPERVEGTIDAANAFIEAQRPIVDELIKRGLLKPDQAAKAAGIPFARIHLGATHGKPEGLIRQAKADLAATRQQARETARQRVSGAAESRAVAAKKLKTAEAGRIAAERTVATLRAKVSAAKSEGGRASALKRVERAQSVLNAARERVKIAKAESRATRAEWNRRAKAASREYNAKVGEADKALAGARKADHQLVDHEGFPLTPERLRAEYAKHGIEEPGFISHRAGARSDHWAPTNERGSLPKGKRTGQSAVRGSYESGFEAVLRQLGRSRGLLDRVKTWDEFITRFGMIARGLKVESMRTAKRVIRDPARYGLNPNIDWVAVRRQPWTAMKSEIEAALEHQDPHLASEGVLSDALAKATSEAGGDGPIVFMPRGVVSNMHAQFQPLGPALKGVQLSTTALKRAVLPFSPSYYFGNAIDNAIRTALAGIGPQHFFAGHQLSKSLSEERKTQLLGAAYSSVEKLAAHRSHEDFAGTALQGVADAAAAFRAAPGFKQLIDLVSATSHAMLSINSKLTERLPQYGALGKIAMQDVRNVQGHWAALLRLQPKFVETIVKGLDNPDTMIRYQKGIEDIYGNWSRMSPGARKFLTNFFPFWTWSRAALKLVYKTLPAHHPIQTALLTAAARMTQEEREKLGLDLLGKEPLPNYLQGGIPIRGSIAPWGKYTSFGYAGHPLESVATGVDPQLRESLAAGEGRDWKGNQLGGDELSHAGAALTGAIGSFVPGYNTVEGLLRSGPGFLSPLHVVKPDSLPFLRSLSNSQQITVPKKGSGGGSGSIDYGAVASGGVTGGGVDYEKVAAGGG